MVLPSLANPAGVAWPNLQNEFYWPPYVPIGTDLDAGGLWWRKVGSPTTAPTNASCTTDSIAVSPGGDEVLKCVTGAASRGLSTTWTYANEKRVKSGKYFSALVAVYIVTAARTLTVRTYTSVPTTIASVAISTVGSWVIVPLGPGAALDGTTVSFDAQLDGSGTFYVRPLGAIAMDVGTLLLHPLPNRGWRWVDTLTSDFVSNVDPGGTTWTTVAVSTTSSLAVMAQVSGQYNNVSASGNGLHLRRQGDSTAQGDGTSLVTTSTANAYYEGTALVALNDSQQIEYGTGAASGNTEHVYLSCRGFFEWQ